MKSPHYFLSLLLLPALFGQSCTPSPSPGESTQAPFQVEPPTPEQVVNVSSNDTAMNRAISEARASLTHFWKVFDHPQHGETDFSLKVKIYDSSQKTVEHFWTLDIEKNQGKIFGTLDNDPVTVKNVKAGERIEIMESDISDWMYIKDSLLFGNYTTRVLLPEMSPKDRADLEAILSPQPY